jgi:hypothetical protein
MPDGNTLIEMAFDRATVAAKVRGREETINGHLVKLLAFDAAPETRAFWRKELARKHFALLAAMRLKPGNRRVSGTDFRDWLYAEPFEGNELGYTAALIRMNEDELRRNARRADEVAAALHDFHAALAPLLAAGDGAGAEALLAGV